MADKFEEEYEKLVNDPNYQNMKDVLQRQKQAADELIASGHLQDPEWIKENIRVLTENEIIKNEVYEWLNSYAQTPEGQANLAYALVNEAGGGDNKMEIEFGSREQLAGANGWGSWDTSHVQLAKEDWLNNKDWVRNFALAHEIRHVGQQNIPNLSQREAFLYHAGIIEADARLTEFCDGVAEGRNPKAEGYEESLRGIFEKEILPYRDKFLAHTNFKTWDEFVKIKDTDPERYNQVMGRIKEIQFKKVLDNLMKTSGYRLQGERCVAMNGTGNLNGLYSWIEQMCERQGMRFERVWPMVEEMATGKREIPGMEHCFDNDGKMNDRGRLLLRATKECKDTPYKYVDFQSMFLSMEKNGIEIGGVTWKTENNHRIMIICDKKGRDVAECINDRQWFEYEYDNHGNRVRKNLVTPESKSTYEEYFYDEEGRLTSVVDQFKTHYYRLGQEIAYKSNSVSKRIYGFEYDRSDRETVVAEHEYFEGDKGLEEISEEKKATRNNKETIEYTIDGRSIRRKYDGDGKIISSSEYIYDKKGHVICSIEKDGNGKVICIREHTYNGLGDETSGVEKDSEGNVKYGWEYTYDDQRNMISEVYKNANDEVTSRWEYTYDDQMNRIGEIHKDGKGNIIDGYGPAYKEALKKEQEKEKQESENAEHEVAHRQREIDNGKGIDEDLKALANGGKGWKSEEKAAKAPAKRRADKAVDKAYYGNRPGGIDDTIAKMDTQERVKINSAVKSTKLEQS